jgi:capsid protein
MSEHAFDAARRLGYRGMFIFPSLEPRRQLTAPTRESIAQKVSWLYNNVDPLRVAVDALTLEEVDTGIWPKATTSNPAFNRAATEAFHNKCQDPRFFHSAAIENYYTAQWLVRRSIMLHGELFGQLLRPDEASGLTSARLHFINGWRCANLPNNSRLDQSKWTDGVRLDRLGRAKEYRFLTEDKTGKTDVLAEDILHFHDRFWTDQVRGVSPLAPVVQKLYSMDDIERAETSGTLLRTMLAYAIERKDDNTGTSLLPGAIGVEEVTNADGSKLVIQKIVSNTGTAREVQVADIPAGQTLKVIESNRAASTVEFVKWLLQGVANCTLYPAEYVFNISGIGQGTVARMVQKRVQRVKNTVRQFQLIPQFCQPYYRFWLWQEIQAGTFNDIEGGVPTDWWRVKHISPADDSVDIGREGKLFDDRLDSGKMSPALYHGMMGEDDEDVEDEIIAARIRRIRKLNEAKAANPDVADSLDYAAVFASAKSAPAIAVAAPEPEDEEETMPPSH